MNRIIRSAGLSLLLVLALVSRIQGQQPVAAEPQTSSGTLQTPREVVPALPVPRLVKFTGSLKDELRKPRTGVVGVTFAIYEEQEGGAALWLETQNVELDEQGRYTALLGASKSEGLPLELFATGEPRWLGVQAQFPRELEQPRVLLVSVPYALKAVDAETLGGLPASAFALAVPSGTASVANVPGTTTQTTTNPKTIGKNTTTRTAKGAAAATPIAANFIPVFIDNSGTLGSSAMLQSGSNIGIGTTSPARSLHIRSSAPTIRLEDSTLPNSFWELQQSAFALDTFGFLRYENGAAVADKSFVVSSAGNLGIGTGTPQRKLHIRSAAPVIRLEDTNLPNSFWELQQSAFVLDTFGFLRYENGAAVQSKSFVMSSGGNFGIGTGTPTQKLEVAGNIKISGGGSALVFPDGTVQTSSNRTRGVTFLAGCDTCALLADTDSEQAIYVNVVGSMTIQSVACYSDAGNPIINVQRDTGVAANILASNLTCSPTGASSSSFVVGQNVLNISDKLDFAMVTAGGQAHRVTVVIQAVLN